MKKSSKTLEAVFAHPISDNLHWNDVMTLLEQLGSVERHKHGKLSIDIDGHRIAIKYSGEKQLDKDQVLELRSFLKDRGISPDHAITEKHPDKDYDQPPLIVVVAHHEAQLWHQDNAGAPIHEDKKLTPHDPRHIRHHLTHHNEDRLHGQRAPEDTDFYKKLVEAVKDAPRTIVLGNATGKSSAMAVFKDYLERHHKDLLNRVDAFVDIDLSALTEPQIREVAARYWH